MRILLHPGSRIQQQQKIGGGKYKLSHLFVDVNFTIFENILINEQRQKKISVD
jgi:hypothetical protein